MQFAQQIEGLFDYITVFYCIRFTNLTHFNKFGTINSSGILILNYIYTLTSLWSIELYVFSYKVAKFSSYQEPTRYPAKYPASDPGNINWGKL